MKYAADGVKDKAEWSREPQMTSNIEGQVRKGMKAWVRDKQLGTMESLEEYKRIQGMQEGNQDGKKRTWDGFGREDGESKEIL